MDAPHLTNGSTNGLTASLTDEAIDSLYAWMPPQTTLAPCPEAVFSLTLKGALDGIEALFTVRGQTAAEFKANLAAVRGLLDQPQPAASPAPQGGPQAASQGKSFCGIHQVAMQWNDGKNGRKGWYSHRLGDGTWCKGR